MKERLKRIAILVLGWLFILLGILGLFLPILQGVLFLLVGLALLSRESVWAKRLIERLRVRFPQLAGKLDQAEIRARDWWQRIRAWNATDKAAGARAAVGLTTLLCAAEVLGMLGFATFPALIPEFERLWGLSKTESGIISGAYFAGYVIAVPVLTSLTDRVDPRKVILLSLIVGALGAAGFALLADGPWTASLFRILQGAGLAGTYMPGLKALSDLVDSRRLPRAVSFYTASFGIGAGLSFIAAGEVTAIWGWQWAFGATALGSATAFLLIAVFLPAAPAREADPDQTKAHLLDFRPVLRNRDAMRYILGYTGHNWELFALRSWMVPFLVFTLALHGGGDPWLSATTIAAIATLLGVPSSIIGNEFAIRFHRARWIALVAALSVAMSAGIGFASSISYELVVALCLLYGIFATGDSAALTAGTVANAVPGQRGATLALHSFIGFMGGIVAPPAVGLVLDLAGRDTVNGWGIAFLAIGLGSAMALASIARVGR